MKTIATFGLLLFTSMFVSTAATAEKKKSTESENIAAESKGVASTDSDHERPSIFAATVEDTAKAENIRLAVSPRINEAHFNSKVVCAEGMVRVRLEGIANGGRELQQLSVPENGLFETIRIVEKNPSTSVVQMIPRKNPEGTCARTDVTVSGGELVISTLFTEAEMERIRAAKERDRLVKEQAVKATEKNEAAPEVSKAAALAASSSAEAREMRAAAQVDDKPIFKKTSGDPNGNTVVGGSSVFSNPKMLVGFGFAAVIAGLALYMKRKKPLVNVDMDKINILSTQRLGMKQQLVLVSVQGTRFLLAVSDKNVSSLGTVSNDEFEKQSRALPAYHREGAQANNRSSSTEQFGLTQQSGPAPQSALNMQAALNSESNLRAQSALETLIGEASRRAAKIDTPVERGRADSFDSELDRALENTAIGREKPRPVGRVDTASNAAGLVALARMRANLKKSNQKSQVFEA